MASQAQRLISLFRTIVLAGVTALLITSAALPMPAQNSVPPTAVQAARMPQFASRLAHPAPQPASRPKPALARQGSRSGPPQEATISTTTVPSTATPMPGRLTPDLSSAIRSPSRVAAARQRHEFRGLAISGRHAGAPPKISITSEPNGGTSYFDQTVNFTAEGGCTANQYGYNVCTESTRPSMVRR